MSDDTPTFDSVDKTRAGVSADKSATVGFVSDASVLTDPALLLKARKQVAATAARQASTSLVEYRSAGQCLVIAKDASASAVEEALRCVESLSDNKCFVLCPLPHGNQDEASVRRELTESGVAVYYRQLLDVSGHLGQYEVTVSARSSAMKSEQLGVVALTESGGFDVILDLASAPSIDAQLAPFGYFHASDEAALHLALEQIPGLIGEFQKPKYFDYNKDICAHSRSQLDGCQNCLDVCATGAITSAGEGIEVDPFLCQGCGHCSTVCPSGAMVYAYPNPASAIESSRELIQQNGDGYSGLLLYPAANLEENEANLIDSQLKDVLPAEVLAIAVEEAGAFGIDYWATMLAAGIHRIVVLLETPRLDLQGSPESAGPGNADGAVIPNAGDAALIRQAELLNRIVAEIGWPGPVIEVVHAISDRSELASQAALWEDMIAGATTHPVSALSPASFVTHNQKRVTFRAAIDHLLSAVQTTIPERMELPPESGSPFGRVAVAQSDCTLCMACVSTCPAGALLDGQSVPQLRFIEANCLQCGLCVNACPEQALSLEPGFEFDTMRARQADVQLY